MTPTNSPWIKLPDNTQYSAPLPSPIVVTQLHPLDEFEERPKSKAWGYYEKGVTCVNTSKTFKCAECNGVFEDIEEIDVEANEEEEVSFVCETCYFDLKRLDQCGKNEKK